MDRLGRRKSTDLRENVVTELNILKATLELGATLPWWLENGDTLGNLTVGTSGFLLPTNYIREAEGSAVRLLDPDDLVTETYPAKMDFEVVQRQTINGIYDLPQIYAIFGGKIFFAPIPNKTYGVASPGYLRTDDIVDNANTTEGWFLNAPE